VAAGDHRAAVRDSADGFEAFGGGERTGGVCEEGDEGGGCGLAEMRLCLPPSSW
jgi:hypothetical protein